MIQEQHTAMRCQVRSAMIPSTAAIYGATWVVIESTCNMWYAELVLCADKLITCTAALFSL